MTVAFVRGLQGDDPGYWKSASLMKHFMANSNEDQRTATSSDFVLPAVNTIVGEPTPSVAISMEPG